MKSRDEFIRSVWEKSEKALAEEKNKGKEKADRIHFSLGKTRKSFLVAAAACMLLIAGTASLGGPQAIYEELFASGIDSAANESISEIEEQDFDSSVQDQETVCPSSGEATEDGSDSIVSSPTITADGTLNIEMLEDDALYEELRKQTDAASKSDDSVPGDLMDLLYLPLGVRIEDSEGNVLIDVSDEKGVLKYMKWFYRLPEADILTNEEMEESKEISRDYYKFIMNCSIGSNTAGADRIYWIKGDVRIP